MPLIFAAIRLPAICRHLFRITDSYPSFFMVFTSVH